MYVYSNSVLYRGRVRCVRKMLRSANKKQTAELPRLCTIISPAFGVQFCHAFFRQAICLSRSNTLNTRHGGAARHRHPSIYLSCHSCSRRTNVNTLAGIHMKAVEREICSMRLVSSTKGGRHYGISISNIDLPFPAVVFCQSTLLLPDLGLCRIATTLMLGRKAPLIRSLAQKHLAQLDPIVRLATGQ